MEIRCGEQVRQAETGRLFVPKIWTIWFKVNQNSGFILWSSLSPQGSCSRPGPAAGHCSTIVTIKPSHTQDNHQDHDGKAPSAQQQQPTGRKRSVSGMPGRLQACLDLDWPDVGAFVFSNIADSVSLKTLCTSKSRRMCVCVSVCVRLRVTAKLKRVMKEA